MADRPRGPQPEPRARLTASGVLVLMGVVAAVFGVSFGATNLLLGGLVLGAAGVVVAADTDGDPGSA